MDTGRLVVRLSSNCCIVMTSDQCPKYLHQLIHVEAADASSLSTKLQESGVCSGALPKSTPCSKAESFFFGCRMAEKAKGFRSELQVKSSSCFFLKRFWCFTLEDLDIYIYISGIWYLKHTLRAPIKIYNEATSWYDHARFSAQTAPHSWRLFRSRFGGWKMFQVLNYEMLLAKEKNPPPQVLIVGICNLK